MALSYENLSTMPVKPGTHLGSSESPLPNSTSPRKYDHSRQPPHSSVVNGVNGYAQNGHLKHDDIATTPFKPAGKTSWKPFLIGVAGGTASGKTSVCHKIMQKLGQNHLAHDKRHVLTISSDSFYRVLNEEERERAKLGEFDFDHPDALDFDLIMRTMRTLEAGKVAEIPVYDFVTHSRLANEHIEVHPADVILFEGILVFYFPQLRDHFQLKLFVDTDADTRLARRVVRDLRDRGRDLPSVIHQYTLFVKPAFEEFCQPTKKYADVIIPRGSENEVAINLIVQHIKEHLLPLAMENGSPRRSQADEAIQQKVKQRQMMNANSSGSVGYATNERQAS